jgi:hypothetical protein
MSKLYPTKDTALIGAAGVHFVVSVLSLRGLIALPTIRNTVGVDVVVVSGNGNWHANLQVKTSRSKVGFWPISHKFEAWNGAKDYYAFVRYLLDIDRLEVFLESAVNVIEQVSANLKSDQERGLKEWAPCWYLRGDVERLRQQWHDFGNLNQT